MRKETQSAILCLTRISICDREVYMDNRSIQNNHSLKSNRVTREPRLPVVGVLRSPPRVALF